MEETRKEEILARSKRENRNGDERERTIRIQGESFSLIFILLMGIVLIAWKRGARSAGRGCAGHVLDVMSSQPGLPDFTAPGQVRWDHSGHQPCVFGL